MPGDAAGKAADAADVGTGAGRVQVFARVRPAASTETIFAPAVDVDSDANRIRVRCDAEAAERLLAGEAVESAAAGDRREFSFDGVFGAEASQREVFNEVGLPVLKECLQGFNGAILAYGQTGSGKTHSLLHQGRKSEEAGLLPRLVASLFVHISQDVANVYQIEAAAVQVYNEQVDDLLHPDHAQGVAQAQGLNVRDGGVVPGLTWLRCQKPDDMLDAFAKARSSIVYAETRMNKASSRSHAVFQIRIARRRRAAGSEVNLSNGDAGAGAPRRLECTHARLCIVDLAGSERVKKSGVEGAHFKEAAAINRSLLAFGNVVSALAAKRSHVPFRDSKLTRILDGAVGGNCKTALLVCASPAAENSQETVGTFEFASRAMRVEVNAVVNQTVVEIGAQALLADLAGEAGELGSVPLAPEIAKLRRESSRHAAQAAEEVRIREEAIAKATEEATRLKRAVDDAQRRLREATTDAEERETRWRDEQARLLQQTEAARNAAADAGERQLALEAEAEQARSATRAAEASARQADARAQQAEHRAEAAIVEAEEARKATDAAEARARQAETQAKAALAEAEEARIANRLVEARSQQAEARAQQAEARTQQAEARSQQAEARAQQAEVQAAKAIAEANDLRRRAEQQSRNVEEEAARKCAAAAAEAEEARRAVLAAEERARQREAQARAAAAEVEAVRKATCEAEVRSQQAEARAQQADVQAQDVLRRAEQQTRSVDEEASRKCANAAAEAAEARRAEQVALQREEKANRLFAAAEAEAAAARASEQVAFQREDDARRLCAAAEAEVERLRLALQRNAEAVAQLAVEQRSVVEERRLKEAHDELSRRCRESRQEDLVELEKHRQMIEEQERNLRHRDQQVEELKRQLENRDATDRIFGAPELRRSGSCRAGSPSRRALGPIPPLPGKKIGDAQAFPDRDRDRVKRQRASSARRAEERGRPSPPPMPLAPVATPNSANRLLLAH